MAISSSSIVDLVTPVNKRNVAGIQDQVVGLATDRLAYVLSLITTVARPSGMDLGTRTWTP
jgi:hypothetical protein